MPKHSPNHWQSDAGLSRTLELEPQKSGNLLIAIRDTAGSEARSICLSPLSYRLLGRRLIALADEAEGTFGKNIDNSGGAPC